MHIVQSAVLQEGHPLLVLSVVAAAWEAYHISIITALLHIQLLRFSSTIIAVGFRLPLQFIVYFAVCADTLDPRLHNTPL